MPTSQILHQSKKLDPWFLTAALYFQSTGLNGEYEGWNFAKFSKYIRPLANSLAAEIYPDEETDYQKVEFDVLVEFLKRLFSKEDSLSANVPLQNLIEELEQKELEARKKEVEVRDQARDTTVSIIESLEKYQQKVRENSKAASDFAEKSAVSLSASPLSESLDAEQQAELTTTLQIELNKRISQTDLYLQTQKLQELPEEEKITSGNLLKQRWQGAWREAVTATEKILAQAGTSLSWEQRNYLSQTFLSQSAISEFSNGLAQIPQAGETQRSITSLLESSSSRLASNLRNTIIDGIVEELATAKTDPRKNFESAWNEAVSSLSKKNPQLSEDSNILRSLKNNLSQEQQSVIANEIAERKKALTDQRETLETLVAPPISEGKKKNIHDEFYATLFSVLPETGYSLEEFQALGDKEKNEKIEALRKQLEDTTLVTLALIADENDAKKQFSKNEVLGITTRMSSLSDDEVVELIRIASQPAEERSFFQGKDSFFSLEPERVKGIAGKNNPSLSGDNTQYRLEANSVENLAKELAPDAYKNGITSKTLPGVKGKIATFQSFFLTLQGVAPEDLENTKKDLLKKGAKVDSASIKDLDSLIKNLRAYQTGQSNKENGEEFRTWMIKRRAERQKLIDSGVFKPIRIPFAKNFNGFIEEVKKYKFNLNFLTNPKSPLGKLLKTYVDTYGFYYKSKLLVMNKLNQFANKTIGKVADWFWKTGAGKYLKNQLQSAGVQGLKKLLGKFSKEAITNLLKTGGKAVATKLGLTAVLSAIGTIGGPVGTLLGAVVGFVGEKLVGSVFKGIKKLGKFALSGFGSADMLLKALGQPESEKDKKSFLLMFVLIIAFLVGGPIITTLTAGAGSVSSTPGLGAYSGGENSSAKCNSSRHLAEEVICQLSERNSPCNHNFVDTKTWGDVSRCFDLPETNFLHKESIKIRFQSMMNSEDCGYHIQCLGFVLAVQNALGQSMDMYGYAGAYAVPPYHQDYEAVTNPVQGDLAVWAGSPGHIAVVLEKNGDAKIIVAEANAPKDAQLTVRSRASIGGGSPTVYLRYKVK